MRSDKNPHRVSPSEPRVRSSCFEHLCGCRLRIVRLVHHLRPLRVVSHLPLRRPSVFPPRVRRRLRPPRSRGARLRRHQRRRPARGCLAGLRRRLPRQRLHVGARGRRRRAGHRVGEHVRPLRRRRPAGFRLRPPRPRRRRAGHPLCYERRHRCRRGGRVAAGAGAVVHDVDGEHGRGAVRKHLPRLLVPSADAVPGGQRTRRHAHHVSGAHERVAGARGGARPSGASSAPRLQPGALPVRLHRALDAVHACAHCGPQRGCGGRRARRRRERAGLLPRVTERGGVRKCECVWVWAQGELQGFFLVAASLDGSRSHPPTPPLPPTPYVRPFFCTHDCSLLFPPPFHCHTLLVALPFCGVWGRTRQCVSLFVPLFSVLRAKVVGIRVEKKNFRFAKQNCRRWGKI
eukprot:Rhum_TRINITY_DN15333_c18_g1::Rhum_TRINITY_DN15333_c18_g1_i1::g.152521::m.152521